MPELGTAWWRRTRSAVFVLFAALQLVAMKQAMPALRWTGDEPRYLYYAVSFDARRDLSLPPDEWRSWLDARGLPPIVENVAEARFRHSPLHAVALSPVAGAFGLDGVRRAQLGVGVLGLAALLAVLLASVPFAAAAPALLFAFDTLPVQPYLGLFYAEVWLLALVSLAWAGIASPRFTGARAALALLACFALPFVHLRGAPVALGLFGLCLARIARSEPARRRPVRALALPLAGATAALALFVPYQLSVAGALTGTASAPIAPSLGTALDRLGVQLFDSQHGLLACNPAWLLGFAGLAIGLLERRPLARQAALLLLLAIAGFVWGNAGASMPARFWVVAVPFLALGLAIWFATLRSWWPLVAAAPLLVLSLLNVALLFETPNLLMDNRDASLSYDRLFAWTGLYLPPLLPWEQVGCGMPTFDQSRERIHSALVLSALAAACFVGANRARTRAGGRAWALAALALVAVPLLHARATLVPPDAFERSVIAAGAGQPTGLVIRFREPTRVSAIRIGEPPRRWPPTGPDGAPAAFPCLFTIRVQETAQDAFEPLGRVQGRSIVALDDRRPVAAVHIAEHGRSDGTWTGLPVAVLRRGD